MRTATECLARADHLDERAANTVAGPVRDGFTEMAAQWRRLALAADDPRRPWAIL